MHIGGTAFDVDYEKYTDLDVISRRKEQLHKIGHKIYYDFQINAFLFCKDIYDYSTIHEAPEFLYTLSSLNDATKGIDTKWKNLCKPYVVKYKSKLKDFAYFTFYGNEREYNQDRRENWCELRRLLMSRAVESAFGDSASQIFAYMKSDMIIAPENILEYVPAEKWRKDVLKYFGKELVDYVEECYGEIDDKKERKELVNLVGTPYVEFDFPYICEIREIVNETIKENKILDLAKIYDKLKIIDDDMLKDDIMKILSDYEKYIQESNMEKAEKCLYQILDMIPEFAGIEE